MYELNVKDQKSRKFILVQLPEECDEKSVAFIEGYKNIAELGKERIRRASKKVSDENSSYKGDLGFKSFKLSKSSFKIWNSEEDYEESQTLEESIRLYADNIDMTRNTKDILYELVLKTGYPLTVPIEEVKADKKIVYSICNSQLIICLEQKVDKKLLRAIVDMKPSEVICLDNAFGGDDQLKTNTVLEMKSEKIVFKTV